MHRRVPTRSLHPQLTVRGTGLQAPQADVETEAQRVEQSGPGSKEYFCDAMINFSATMVYIPNVKALCVND